MNYSKLTGAYIFGLARSKKLDNFLSLKSSESKLGRISLSVTERHRDASKLTSFLLAQGGGGGGGRQQKSVL